MRWLVVFLLACQDHPPPPHGKVEEGPIEATPLPPVVTLDQVGRVLHENAGVFQACHDRYSDKATTVTVDFTVSAEGRATGMHGSDGHAEVRDCIERVIGALMFPKGGHAVDVSFPFSFQ
jgi:hypothetical protein